ncbi:hypothetical protein DFH11DRAFT_540810 [Phellopilus nigrolimitatus]|nr:hypothetical protein DFH11DRAFT_540810 [Phellopilus nigrolimitatus]
MRFGFLSTSRLRKLQSSGPRRRRMVPCQTLAGAATRAPGSPDSAARETCRRRRRRPRCPFPSLARRRPFSQVDSVVGFSLQTFSTSNPSNLAELRRGNWCLARKCGRSRPTAWAGLAGMSLSPVDQFPGQLSRTFLVHGWTVVSANRPCTLSVRFPDFFGIRRTGLSSRRFSLPARAESSCHTTRSRDSASRASSKDLLLPSPRARKRHFCNQKLRLAKRCSTSRSRLWVERPLDRYVCRPLSLAYHRFQLPAEPSPLRCPARARTLSRNKFLQSEVRFASTNQTSRYHTLSRATRLFPSQNAKLCLRL